MGLFDNFKHRKQPATVETSLSKNYADSSKILPSERKYYQPDEYYTFKTHEGTPFELTVIPFEKRKESSNPSRNGLYVPEILMLSFCGNFPEPSNGYPAYWWFKYGVRDVGALLNSLKERGFIEINPKTKKYRVTELGKTELKENEYVAYTHGHSKRSDFTAWEMNELLAASGSKDWMSLFCEKTGELPPLEVSGEAAEKEKALSAKGKIPKRVPLSQILNFNDWEKGYKEGSPYYFKGEQYRKEGYLYTAIEQYDLARYHGYDAPALYNSYAMTFRKLKDYDNEIKILKEGMKRHTSSSAKKKFEERIEQVLELKSKQKPK